MTAGDDELPTSLDEALKALEETVSRLEEPELPLEKSLELFEKGTRLSQICSERLRDAETKVEVLLRKLPTPESAEDFSSEELPEMTR